jgi:predicted PurR-regulated permease PerM
MHAAILLQDLACMDHVANSERAPARGSTRSLLTFVGLAATLYIGYRTVRPFVVLLLVAAATASILFRPYLALTARLRGRRRLTATLAVATLLIGIILPVVVAGTFAVHRLVLEASELAVEVQRGGWVQRVAARLGPLGGPAERVAAELQPKLAAAVPQLAARGAQLVAAVGSRAMHAAIALFLYVLAVYYFLVNGDAWRERLIRLVPFPASEVRPFVRRFSQVSMAVLVGNVGTALAQGIAATLGYFLFGAPVPLLWGLCTVFAALIPLVGPALIWVPMSIAVGVEHGWLRGVGLAAYGALIVGTVDNLVRPILTRRGMRMHPLLVFVAIFGGLASYGFAGLFLGPLTMALVVTVVERYERSANAGGSR